MTQEPKLSGQELSLIMDYKIQEEYRIGRPIVSRWKLADFTILLMEQVFLLYILHGWNMFTVMIKNALCSLQ